MFLKKKIAGQSGQSRISEGRIGDECDHLYAPQAFQNYNLHKRNFTILTVLEVLQSCAAFFISLALEYVSAGTMHEIYTCPVVLPITPVSQPHFLVTIHLQIPYICMIKVPKGDPVIFTFVFQAYPCCIMFQNPLYLLVTYC